MGRLAIGICLLAYLFSRIPWTDQVVLVDLSGAATTVLVDELPEPADRGAPLTTTHRGLDEFDGWSFSIPADGSIQAIEAPADRLGPEFDLGESRFEPGLSSSLELLSLPAFLMASILALAGTITASLRWKVLLGAVGIRVPLRRTVRLNLAGLAASQVLLGSVGGDLVKGALVTRDSAVPVSLASKTQAVFALMMDRVVGLAALLIIGSTAAYMVRDTTGSLATWFALALSVLLLGVVGVLLLAGRFEFPSGTTPLWRILHSLHNALAQYRQRPWALVSGLLLSFGSHSLLIAAIAYLGGAVGMELHPLRFFLLIPVVETAQAVPVSPAGWGVAESLYVVLFEDAGETATLALSLALSVRAVTLAQALLGVPGLLLLLRRRSTQAADQ